MYTNTKNHSSNYIGNLDAIKIIAAIGIVFHHYQQLTSVKLGGGIEFYGGKFVFGYLVELFFVISGFLTAFTYSDNQGFIRWMYKKIERVFPYAFVACLFCLLSALVYYQAFGEKLIGGRYDLPTIVTSLLLVHTGWIWEYTPAVNNPTWYLCILIICYIIFYVIMRVFSKKTVLEKYGFLIVALISAGLYFYCQHSTISIPFIRINNCRGYGAFFTGCTLCSAYKYISKRKLIILTVAFWIVSIVTFLRIGMSNWYILTYFFFPAIVLSTILLPQLNNKIIKRLGAISFEVYLWHVPLYMIMVTIFALINYRIVHSYWTMILFSGFVWLWGTGIYYWFEYPLHNWLSIKNQS